MSKITPESSPVHESIPGRRRGGGGLCDRRDQVVGPDHRGQRHDPYRRGRAQRARRRRTSASSARCQASRSPIWSIPTRGRTRSGSIRSRRRVAASRRPCRTSAACSTTSRSTPSRSPRPITGMRLITIWACQAGKDVYVEKPCSHNVHEGRIAVEAARRYNRIVQHGTQSRSIARVGPGRRGDPVGQARQAAGLAGPLLQAPRQHRRQTDRRLPRASSISTSGSGPAPKQPYHANLVHYNWHWFWDFGNGDIGNQGVHEMDKARWLIPAASSSGTVRAPPIPKTVLSLGGRFGYHDQGETANTQIAIMDYGDTQLIFEVRGLKTERLPRARRSATSPISKRESSSTASSIPRGRPSRCRSRAS